MTENALPLSAKQIRKRDSMQDKKRQEAIAGYTFMAPALLVFIFFLVVPVLVAFYLSFTDWNGTTALLSENSHNWVGTQNYERLLTEDGFRRTGFFNALKNTVYYVIGVVPIQTAIALVLAVIVNQKWLKGRGVFRTIFYFPSITSSVVISIVFLWLFSTDGLVNGFLSVFSPDQVRVNWTDDATGVMHWILDSVFGMQRADFGDWTRESIFGIRAWDWISGPSVTLFMIMLLNTWTTIGTMMIIFLAALQNIPSFVYEAARIDGAGALQIFRRITLPLLRPTTFFVVTLGLIGTFQVFDQVYIIGGGRATRTIAVLVHENAFGQTGNMGLATATAMILFVIIFVFTLLQRRIVGGEHGEA